MVAKFHHFFLSFWLIAEVAANEGCLMYTWKGTCCQYPQFNIHGKIATSCWRDHYSKFPQCRDVNNEHLDCMEKLPSYGYAVPLGMMSGEIMSAQLLVPSLPANADRARNFDFYKKSGVGWRPDNGYLSNMGASITCSSHVVAHQFPKAMITSLPVFFHIDFLRMKRLFYLIIGDGVERPAGSNGRLTGREFLLSYKDFTGKVVPYGTDSLYATGFFSSQPWDLSTIAARKAKDKRQLNLFLSDSEFQVKPGKKYTTFASLKVLPCKLMFGFRFQECRLKLQPFRAASVRIVSKDYSSTYLEEFLIEVGGLDYLEADHHWYMDSVRTDGPQKFFPDVRGGIRLVIGNSIAADYVGPEAWFPASTNAFPADHCLSDPANCKDGLSVSFWFKNGGERFPIISAGHSRPCSAYWRRIGFMACYHSDKLEVWFTTATSWFVVSHSIADRKWNHYVATWSQSGGFLYVNGVQLRQMTKVMGNRGEGDKKIRVADSSTAELKSQAYDFRVWSYKLSSYDVSELYSAGKGSNQSRMDGVKKFRPSNCLHALQAYGRSKGSYDIYTPYGSIQVHCSSHADGVKFYFDHNLPATKLSGPWSPNPFEAALTYNQLMKPMRYLIEKATSCKQVATFTCKNAPVSGKITIYNKDNSVWNKDCDCATGKSCTPVTSDCNCDGVSLAGSLEESKDTKTFGNKDFLPLSKISVSGMNSAEKYQMFTVGPVECTIARTCEDALKTNGMIPGHYYIAPNNNTHVKVHCSVTGSDIKTLVYHADGGTPIHVTGFEPRGSYVKHIRYGGDLSSIIAIVKSADRCRQAVDFSCKGAMINPYTWFTDRNYAKINRWAGAPSGSTGCKCGVDGSCVTSSQKCNCDSNDNSVVLSDNGIYESKEELPLTSLRAGDTGGATEYFTVSIGNLECYSTNTKASSANIAMGKVTNQSSTSYGGVSSRAVDGNKNVIYSGDSCTHTDYADEPWWSVDLGKPYLVHSVQVTNRDEESYRLSNFDVTVDNHLCWHHNGVVGSGATILLSCTPVVGRIVKIQLRRSDVLTLCEVEVYEAGSSSGIPYQHIATEAVACEDEMDSSACCKFPFTYKDVSYTKCTSVDSIAPWCSLTSVYSGQFRFCTSSRATADISFSVESNFENYGDWKLGSDCNNEGNSGPCFDMSFSSKPSEKESTRNIGLLVPRIDLVSEFNFKDQTCHTHPYQVFPSMHHSLFVLGYQLNEMSFPLALQETKLRFDSREKKPGEHRDAEAIVHIYTAIPSEVYDDNYIKNCRHVYFRNGLHFGPIVWKVGPYDKDKAYFTPDLKTIITPVLRSKHNSRLYFIFEWKEFPVQGPFRMQFYHPFFLRYQQKKPGNYLYADSFDFKSPGTPLIYNTRHFSPSKKCLQFWYHMDVVGDATLSVNLYQKGNAASEILKISGDQGANWKRATVDLASYLSEEGMLFNVAFVATPGINSSKSIAIDDISFLADACIVQPTQSTLELKSGINPEILIPLDSSHYDQGKKTASSVEAPTVSLKYPTADKFGHPHLVSYFNGSAVTTATYNYGAGISVSGYFTVCMHIKPVLRDSLNLVTFAEGPTEMIIAMLADGSVSLNVDTADGSITNARSKPILKDGQWTFVCFVLESYLGVVKIYADGKLANEVDVGFVKPAMSVGQVTIGGVYSGNNTFSGVYISCVQLHKSAIDKNFIKILELCPNRHVKGACSDACEKDGVCDPLTRKCVCPSYNSRFRKENCDRVTIGSEYGENFISFASTTHFPGKYYESLAQAVNITQTSSNQQDKFFRIPGPAGSGLCVLSGGSVTGGSSDCFKAGECTNGATLVFWIQVPQVADWKTAGNLTLLKKGHVRVLYGMVNDIRNGTTKPIASVMIGVSSGNKMCIWTTMIYNTMITSAWAHIAVTLDSTKNIIAVYYNGKRNHAVKDDCKTPSPNEANFMFGNVKYMCLDEVATFDKPLTANQIEGMYNGSVYSGQQAVPSKISFRKLTVREPDDLWGVDKSDRVYKYYNGSWKKVSDETIREIHTGLSGVVAVFKNNSLYKRVGITLDNPYGDAWQEIRLNVAFKGAITELSSREWGTISAKSFYQWHCVNILSKSAVKTVSKLYKDSGSYSGLEYACTKKTCWSIKPNNEVLQFNTDANDACLLKQTGKLPEDVTASRLGMTWLCVTPFIVRLNDTKIIANMIRSDNVKVWGEVSSNLLDAFVDVVGLNGLPLGVQASGDLQLLSEEGLEQIYTIRDGLGFCFARSGNRIKLSSHACHHYFAFADNGCLFMYITNRYLKFIDNDIQIVPTCEYDSQVKLNMNGYLELTNGNGKCIARGDGDRIGLYWSGDGKCTDTKRRILIFHAVSPIKKIPSHYLIKGQSTPGNSEVSVEATVRFLLRYPRWSGDMAQRASGAYKFFCTRLVNEIQQQFAGNVNYRRTECGEFQKHDCIDDIARLCITRLKFKIFFAHLDEGSRSILYSKQFKRHMTDCNGIQCQFIVKDHSVGVNLRKYGLTVNETGARSVKLQSIPPHKTSHSASAGYNVTAAGFSRYGLDVRTFYITTIYKGGDILLLQSLPPYFQFNATVQPLFIQGTGNPSWVLFNTSEATPSEAPGLTVSVTDKHSLGVRIQKISDSSWNGAPVKYRIYYESILVLGSPVSLNDLAAVNRTHKYRDFIVDGTLDGIKTIPELEVFTNYSLIIAANNIKGFGPMAQFFWRTAQGEPEATPPNFNLTTINSTHVLARWSPMTTDIELLNGWNLSSYTLRHEERSEPPITVPLNGELKVGPEVFSVEIGPFMPAREYMISIAGDVESRSGNFTSLCIRTEEAAPSSYPTFSNISGIDSSYVNLSTGYVKLEHEHGEILYYNISVKLAATGEETFYIAYITGNLCLDEIICKASPDCDPNQRGNYMKQTPKDLISYNCSAQPLQLPRTSFVVTYRVNNLLYWTEYNISSSACNKKGCGLFNEYLFVKTDEHAPTCAPNLRAFENTSSLSMNASWYGVPLNCAHGVLWSYNVFISLKAELSGSECFHRSSCWESHNSTSSQTKYLITINATDLSYEFVNLDQYREYCIFLQAVNSKGRGPASVSHCAFTAEDAPDGPPKTFNVTATSSTILTVNLSRPEDDLMNGIIRGYQVFYTECDEFGNRIGNETMIDFECGNESNTLGEIKHLKQYTWYTLKARSYTSIGNGPNTSHVQIIRTLEDVPTAPPRDLNITDISEKESSITFKQTESSHLNGIFTKFNVEVTENRRDGRDVFYQLYIVKSSNEEFQSNSSMPWAVAYLDLTGSSTSDQFNVTMNEFRIELSGLLPYTYYNVSISTCTKIGCGVAANATFRTKQSVPTGTPEFMQNATELTNSIGVVWQEPPVMKTNGRIIGYLFKWMKNCEYLRMMKLPETLDCLRVPPENTTSFETKREDGFTLATTIDGLTPFTLYRFEVCAETIKGVGPCYNATYRTDEGVPCAPPNVTGVIPMTGKSFRIEWEDVPLSCQYGIIKGYYVYHQKTAVLNDPNSTVWFHVKKTSNQPPPNFMILDDLALKSNHTLMVTAYTSKGPGVNSSIFFGETGDFRHGNWTEWSKWSFCSESCGGGVTIRERTCDNPAPYNGGDDCSGSNNETKRCNTEICSGFYVGAAHQSCIEACRGIGYYCNPFMINDETSYPFEKSGYNCIDNTSNAVYSKNYHPSIVRSSGKCEGFKQLPATINCTVKGPNDGDTLRLCDCIAPGDCGCEEWAQWSICSVPKCGGGTKRRERICEKRPWCPPGNTSQVLDCNTNPCPVDGNWGQWSEITPCNKSCGYGYRHRHRACDSPADAHGGEKCYGPAVDVIPECNVQKCPVHGQWGAWGEWRQCNQPCGGGISLRRKYCDSPAPRYNGRYCEGSDIETSPCNSHACEGVEILFTVKLTDFTWDYHLVYQTHPKAIALTETTRENVRAVYNYSSIVNAVTVLNYMKGSVIANFSIFYVKVTQSEVLLLQDYITTTGKLNNLSTILQTVKPLQVVAEPPTDVQAISYEPFSMNLTWTPPKDYDKIVNISGYYVFYREYDGAPGTWDVAGVPGLNTTSFLLRDLKPFTKYRLRMTLAVRHGNGPASDEIVNSTIEGVPTAVPTNLRILPTSANEVYLQWDGIPDVKFNGRALGYRINYKPYLNGQYKTTTVPKTFTDTAISGLKAFTLYDIEVEAYSGAGPGLPLAGVTKTPEGVPSIAPPAFTVEHGISTSMVIASWGKIPTDQVNGRLLGYKLKYTITLIADKATVGAPVTKIVTLDKYTFRYKIHGLQSYTTYAVSVAGYTAAGDGPYSTPVDSRTCKCPPNVFLNWYSNPPYVAKGAGLTMTGIMATLIENMIRSSCGKCGSDLPKVHKFQSRSGENPLKKHQNGVKKSIGKEFHISFPIFGYSTITRYMDKHVFILFIQSSGSATIVKNEIDYSKTTLNAFKSIGNIWPMYIIIVLLTTIAGIFIWLAERRGNEEFTRGKFFDGMLQGFWWAFISMTTVGYGDITPRTFLGRVIAIIWTLAGLVLSGILTGALTSSVTSMTFPPPATLYDTECAALNSSFEYNLGVRRNAKVNSKREYGTFDEIFDAVSSKEVSIALLDAFTAAGLIQKIQAKKLKVSGLINANTGYGVVLSNEFIRLESDFRSFIASNQRLISGFTSNMTAKLLDAQSGGEEEVPLLFDPSTAIFWDMIKGECFLLGICTGLGLIYNIFLSARRRKAKIMSESQILLEKMTDFDNSVASFEEDVNTKFEDLEAKHKAEIAELCRLQKSYQRYLKRHYPDIKQEKIEAGDKNPIHAIHGNRVGHSET